MPTDDDSTNVDFNPSSGDHRTHESSDRHQLVRKLENEVGKREDRKLKARRQKYRSIWFGLGMFGMIGWAVAIPMLVGIAIGYWIDHRWPSPYSWTLMLMMFGVALGCLNAWNWIQKEGHPGSHDDEME